MLFKEMGLSPEIIRGIEALGFETATPIQEKVIPVLMRGDHDIIGLAQTGTGKTAAFGLPSIEKIDLFSASPQLLILCPTRELCMQITRDLENFSKFISGIRITSIYGGASMDQQIRSLRQGSHIVVATPGRIHDLIRRNRIDLSGISTLVLDEADEMLKMGFREDLDAILAQTPGEKCTLLFSATMAPGIAAIARKYMNKPVEFTMGTRNSAAENIAHIFHMVHSRDRYDVLKRVVDFHPEIYGIVFCRTRQETKDVADRLMQDGYNAESLHGDLTQAQRDHVMHKFRGKNVNLLVATDVAARGLDVNDLTHIINYNHRTGRTGRAGKKGTAVSIVTARERDRIFQIENVTKKKIEKRPVPAGKEICERRLYHMVGGMRNAEVHNQIEPYLDKVYGMLADMPKEEIIKRVVSKEFNRFLEYYKDAPDLNHEKKSGRSVSPALQGRPADGKRSSSQRKNRGPSMSRVLFNVGKGKNITRQEIVELFAGAPGASNVVIGNIEIFKRMSAVEVESTLAGLIIDDLNSTIYKGVRIEAEVNAEYTGNDFRDRNKGPRGRRKIYQN
jgi:ATP-dependent RNA helicase DeaD